MLNQLVIVGRLVDDVEIIKLEDDRNVSYLKLACRRNYKDITGEYPVDIIPITLWNIIALNTAEYCHKGDLIGVKGRLECVDDKIQVIAEKISFLSNKNESKGE